MKLLLIIISVLSFFVSPAYSQGLEVPDSILLELKTVEFIDQARNSDTLSFKINFPESYDSTKTYPVVLCLSGGNQSEAIVNYCYAAWFRTNYFNDYITILPLSNKNRSLRNYSKEDILALETTIKRNYNVADSNWIIAGTSNGGVASFHFVSVSPKLYEGVIVMPGTMDSTLSVNNDWKHLQFVMAYGEKDSEFWVEESLKTKKRIESYVRKVSTIILEGQGHILPIGFNIDQVYRVYFENR